MKKFLLISILILGLVFVYSKLPERVVEEGSLYTISNGVYLKYRENFGTSYIRPLDWPPQVGVLDQKFSCTEAGRETARAGKTELRRIGTTDACVTTLVEGAAGSIYTQYAYAIEKENKTYILTFSTKATQCGNYPEQERLECEREREVFDIDDHIAPVLKSLYTESVSDYKRATYLLSGEKVSWGRGVVYFGNELKKDINGDGLEDITFLARKEEGDIKGFYVFAGINTGSGYRGSQGMYLGEDISPQNTNSGEGRSVIANFVDGSSVGKSMWLLFDSKTSQFGEWVKNF